MLGAGLMALSVSAKAGTLLVTWVDPVQSATWEQSTNPTPSGFVDASTNVPIFDSTLPSISEIFYFSSASGGFESPDPHLLRAHGPILFSGSTAAPIFAPGSYTLTDDSGQSGTLTFSAIPEPSTWAMMLSGFAGLGYAGWRARRKTARLAD
jgi:hypothetical protein